MTYAGIDYGMGTSNINHATGVRYGVISQHSVSQAWCDSAEPDYGKPTCPKCGNEAKDYGDTDGDFEHEGGCTDYACEQCKISFDSQDAFGDEPQSWNYEDDGYTLTDCLDSDIFILDSPYYTFAPFCSPCVPGAGNTDDAEDQDESNGVKTYCLGHDWFDEKKAPYRIFRVSDNSEVLSV